MKRKFSVSEIQTLVSEFRLLSLPNTGRAIQYRAQNENWDFEEVPSQGGKKGLKKIYPLPNYVLEELREKGVLHLIEGEDYQPETEHQQQESPAEEATGLDYIEWAQQQDPAAVAPVRYYKEVYASAGSGAIPWDTKPEAMWFRVSFFKALGVRASDCFCTRIDGDSMAPTLIDQGTALWLTTNQYTREGIYLIRQFNELRVKRLQRASKNLYNLISDNPNKAIYPTTELDLTRIPSAEFEILGKYLWSCGIAK